MSAKLTEEGVRVSTRRHILNRPPSSGPSGHLLPPMREKGASRRNKKAAQKGAAFLHWIRSATQKSARPLGERA